MRLLNYSFVFDFRVVCAVRHGNIGRGPSRPPLRPQAIPLFRRSGLYTTLKSATKTVENRSVELLKLLDWARKMEIEGEKGSPPEVEKEAL